MSVAQLAGTDVQVLDAEFKRLLGFPPDHEPNERIKGRMQWARQWYAEHGRPWSWVRNTDDVDVDDSTVTIDGTAFKSAPLASRFRSSKAYGAALVAVSAGPEAEAEAARLWKTGQADKYFFLETYASAVVERLTAMAGAELCAHGDESGFAVLPHYSPGYPEWDIMEQQALRDLLDTELPGPVEVMWSGMLRPKKSLVAVFGLTREVDLVQRLTGLVPCESCALEGCAFRRKPYQGVFRIINDGPFQGIHTKAQPMEIDPTLDPDAKYCVATRPLKKWAKERLTLKQLEDGSIRAVFHYPGSTCSNMGVPLAFLYEVTLSSPETGYVIQEEACAPEPGDIGHKAMCSYKSRGDDIVRVTAEEKPLLGCPLNDVVSWDVPGHTTGCYCKGTARTRKWGLVLSTLHYALAHPADYAFQAEESISA